MKLREVVGGEIFHSKQSEKSGLKFMVDYHVMNNSVAGGIIAMEKSCFIEVETISHARNVNRIESKESLNERSS